MYHWTNPDLTYPAQKIDCRKCVHCRKNRGAELADCCVLENEQHESAYFITLTKKPEYEKEHPKYEKKEIKNFIKRLLRFAKKTQSKTIKAYRVHEHGKFGRSHYHLITFGLSLSDLKNTPRPDTFSSEIINRLWPHGHSTVQALNHATAMYQSLYLDKDLKNGHANSARKSVSYHSGIGTNYFLRNYKEILTNGFIMRDEGRKMKIPRKFLRIAQKHLDALTLTTDQYCYKYSKEHYLKVLDFHFGKIDKVRLCTINLEPNKELAELYYHFKNKPREEEKNIERLKQIQEYNFGLRKQKPDFWQAGLNTIHNERQKLEKDKI